MYDQTSLKTECAQCSAYTVLRLYTVSSVADLPTQSCDYVRVEHIAELTLTQSQLPFSFFSLRGLRTFLADVMRDVIFTNWG